MNYDLLMLAHPKDYTKLEYSINSCMEFLNPKPDNIYLVSPTEITSDKIQHIPDEDALPIDCQDIKFKRKNWIYQQFIKLFQNFTENDFYLAVDSDVIFNNQQKLFQNKKPVFFISDREQFHKPYFNFMEKWSGMERVVDHTFINDFMMFDKKICREMLPDINTFLDYGNQVFCDQCVLSEFEMYGNYVSWAHPEMYEIKSTKTQLNGKYQNNPWQRHEIESLITRNRITDLDLFTIHSWT